MISCGPIVVPNLFHVLPLVKQPIGGEGGGGVKAMVENGIVDNVRRESPCQIPPPSSMSTIKTKKMEIDFVKNKKYFLRKSFFIPMKTLSHQQVKRLLKIGKLLVLTNR